MVRWLDGQPAELQDHILISVPVTIKQSGNQAIILISVPTKIEKQGK